MTPHAVVIQGHTVDVTDRFTYLGSDISSWGRSTPEMFRRIGLASSVMGQLTSIWRQSRLILCTKLRLYNALVVSVALYGAETWTLTKSDEQKLESFQMSCLRRILGICWFDFVPNVSVMNQTQQQSIHNRIRDRRISVFGHVRRLQESLPAHEALHLVVISHSGRSRVRHANHYTTKSPTSDSTVTRTTYYYMFSNVGTWTRFQNLLPGSKSG